MRRWKPTPVSTLSMNCRTGMPELMASAMAGASVATAQFVVTGLSSGRAVASVVSPANRLYFLRAQTVPPVVDDSATDANFVVAPDGRVWFGA